ncbi:MAG: hypothetical protein ACP5OO_06220 [Chloroflexia bacterium]
MFSFRFSKCLLLSALLFLVASLILANTSPGFSADLSLALPEPRPKLSLSIKEAYPAIVATSGQVTYTIVLRNTGATSAPDTLLYDPFPAGTTYNGDARSSGGTLIAGPAGITWTGEVGFDSSVWITFSVTVGPTYTGRLTNTASLTQPDIPASLTLTAICTVTDVPILTIAKEGTPALPGAGKPLTYTLWVGNIGRPALALPITVTDRVPGHTTLLSAGSGAITDTWGHITWTVPITLALGERHPFTFSVLVDPDVPNGTPLLNAGYAVTSALPGVGAGGTPYTLTVVPPSFLLIKETDPEPPGSNRALAYTLTLYNQGSLATSLVVTDIVPTNVTYLSGGTYLSATRTVSWTLPYLAPGEKATFTFTAYVGNLPGGTPILNDAYGVCCAEGVCAAGRPFTSTVQGPILDKSFKAVDPIAKKPGGGTAPLTYTIGIRNTGAGNAFDAHLTDYLYYLGSINQVIIDPPTGVYTLTGCGAHCNLLQWSGNIPHDSQITFTIYASSSYAGVPVVTNTAVISDDLTGPVSATTRYLITFDARLNVYKDAPAYIGPNETMTYTLHVVNSAFATSPTVILTDVLPIEVSFITASHGGKYLSATRTVSWTLPPIGTGADLYRTLTVQVGNWPSGTLIINRDVLATCPNCILTGTVFQPVTTTVQVHDLGDSYKEVFPALAYPAPAVVLTYTLHLLNPTGLYLEDVRVTDYFPWVQSTYNRDAVASAGSVVSDIVHLEWFTDMAPHSAEALTLSVLVDPWYKGVLTNTAVITHPSLSQPVTVTAVAYVTDEPVLRLSKRATPDPVALGSELLYTLYLRNLGQRATGLVISDTLPAHTTYVPGSATRGGALVGDTVRWEWPEIAAAGTEAFSFRVLVHRGPYVRNAAYWARCAEGFLAYGEPVETRVLGGTIYLPLLLRHGP